ALIAKDIEFSLNQLEYSIVGIAYNSTMALDMIHNRKPDLVLLDIELNSDLSGIDIANILNEKYKIPFIYLTSYADPSTIDSVKKTLPFGYILKPFSEKELFSAIELASYRIQEQVNKGFPDKEKINSLTIDPLTTREYELLFGLFQGKSNQELAKDYYISVNTIKSHLKNIYSKMGVTNRHKALSKIFEIMR
ncbi:MAG TPA: response regulator transcription factor, partial [Bacteroidetes bacterium]|nr:response regulator transcription factor [Bacteroidota bacterium]